MAKKRVYSGTTLHNYISCIVEVGGTLFYDKSKHPMVGKTCILEDLFFDSRLPEAVQWASHIGQEEDIKFKKRHKKPASLPYGIPLVISGEIETDEVDCARSYPILADDCLEDGVSGKIPKGKSLLVDEIWVPYSIEPGISYELCKKGSGRLEDQFVKVEPSSILKMDFSEKSISECILGYLKEIVGYKSREDAVLETRV